jgi:hypothetical protein
MKSTTSRREFTKPSEPRMPTCEEISARAYDLYLERGAVDGYALEDWLRAEYELIELAGRAEPVKAAS